jgi:cytochrome c oxidase cbb3-type subunit 3
MGPIRFACLPILSASLVLAQQSTGVDNPAGQALFQKACTSCHGGNAKGGRGPDLTTGQWRWGGSDEAILKNILQGIPGTQMPAFPMSANDGEQIVAYLHSLSNNAPEEKLRGIPAAGRKLFYGSAKCSQCHMFEGRGGRLGPDLSSIRNERKAAELQEAIVNPDKSLRPGYETVEIVEPSSARCQKE